MTQRSAGGSAVPGRHLPLAFRRLPHEHDATRVRATGWVREEFTTCMVGPVLHVRDITAA